MCLGVPGKVVAIDDNVATVEFWGVHRQVRLDIVDEPVTVGDFVLNHVGFAIRRIPASEAAATLHLYDELLAADDGDLMGTDVRAEIQAARARTGNVPADGAVACPIATGANGACTTTLAGETVRAIAVPAAKGRP